MSERSPTPSAENWTLYEDPVVRAAASRRLDSLHHRYFHTALRAARRLLDDDDARDVAQTIFLRIWAAGPSCVSRLYTSRFFERSATNLALDMCARGGGARAKLEYECLMAPQPNPEECAYAEEVRDIVRNAIRELPKRCAIVAGLRYDHGMTCTEIARALGIRVKSVERHVARARRYLIGVLPVDELQPHRLDGSNSEGGGNNGSIVIAISTARLARLQASSANRSRQVSETVRSIINRHLRQDVARNR